MSISYNPWIKINDTVKIVIITGRRKKVEASPACQQVGLPV
ncbi:hypothetical protein DBT_0124 [Dissulfuribacter thermophilus]|uniref:Uncharacterized protein n=1 Tax=Dissulfuribacter thermophilus TaxID=1156395 RepID=A0A1B9F8P6_9BACT|nr:hypothetical protein DBT_0124 [Dissulfuribacter thermophilus]